MATAFVPPARLAVSRATNVLAGARKARGFVYDVLKGKVGARLALAATGADVVAVAQQESDWQSALPSIMLCHSGRQLVGSFPDTEPLGVAWQGPRILDALGVSLEEQEVDAAVGGSGEGKPLVPAVVLSDPADVEDPICVAVDVSSLDEGFVLSEVLRASGGSGLEDVQFLDTRSLMVRADPASLLDCGRARAMLGWHASNKFCGKCGTPTVSIEGGAKRKCSAGESCGARVYPRTDPVAIMLVYDAKTDRCLLGRSRRFRSGMYTCLSGFVEPAEPLEMAVRREVFEEAGIEVGAVEFVASQPWPVGRGGTCELMLGCLAEALSTEINVDQSEMEDVRWFTREEAEQAHKLSVEYANGGGQPPEGLLWVPGSYAIAHHLVAQWLRRA
eukprot:CAMPEP_0118865168 /NCGR_PEP_ID=MMETSP1163-20130328/9521_1 /TAXON_ID=124430 /ORGANISM="Phaeomonas parva, Strain CCMP2877" /LENGTH=388 /DNA_ID=CAMNT_0006799369 /DNA_START=175 /DNA_END=1341 /DNA_ORIENTATION=+